MDLVVADSETGSPATCRDQRPDGKQGRLDAGMRSAGTGTAGFRALGAQARALPHFRAYGRADPLPAPTGLHQARRAGPEIAKEWLEAEGFEYE